MEKIVIATDGSPAAHEAVDFGLDLAKEHGATVDFVHVLQLALVPRNGFGAVHEERHEEAPEDRRVLEEAEALADLRSVRSTTELLRGDVVDEIVAYADNVDADLIVLGARGRGALPGALLGSVSRGVLAESKRPVAIVRGEAPVAAPAAAV